MAQLLGVPSTEQVPSEASLEELGLSEGLAVLLRDELQKELKGIRRGKREEGKESGLLFGSCFVCLVKGKGKGNMGVVFLFLKVLFFF